MTHNILMKINGHFTALLIVSLIALTGCSRKQGEETGIAHKEPDPNTQKGVVQLDMHKVFHASIRVEPVAMKSVAVPLSLSGKVSLNEQRLAHVTSRVAGRVEAVTVFTNDRVSSGRVIAKLFSREFLAQQSEHLQTLERLRRLKQAGAGSDELRSAEILVGASRSALRVLGLADSAISRIEAAGIPEQYLEVQTPISGTIIETHIRLGETIGAGDDLATISDLSNLWVLADIYEEDIQQVTAGMRVRVQTPAYPGVKFSGTVNSVYGVLDPKTRTAKARIDIIDPLHRLKPEMFCTVKVQTKFGSETIKISSGALLGETEKHFVFVALNDSTFEKRDVRTGAENREFSEILDGLLTGEKVVVHGGFFLKSELAKETFSEEH